MNTHSMTPELSDEEREAFEELKRSAQNLHNQLCDKIYAGSTGIRRAELVIEVTNSLGTPSDPTGGHPGYDSTRDRILLRIGGHNIHDEVADLADPARWPPWQAALLEEVVHEYERKVVCGKPTRQGLDLFEKFGQEFDEDPRHNEIFFTAISQIAPLIGLTPEQLIRGIK
jgi:hypothetical protein